MKKLIIYLGIALVAFMNVSLASNNNVVVDQKILISSYETPTPLCIAISKGDIELVKKFIEYGADVNEKSNGMTPLMYAARYNKVEIIKYLLQKGANREMKDSQGFSALKYAELSNALEAVSVLKASNVIENRTDDSHLKSTDINTSGHHGTALSTTFVYEQAKVTSVEDSAILNPESVLSLKSKKTIEEIIAEDNKIIDSTVSDEIRPLDFKKINKKSVFTNKISAKNLVGIYL